MFEIKHFLPVEGRTINIRSENHGAENVICVDWGVKITVPNDWLDNLDKNLKAMFYKAADGVATDQPELDGVEVVSAMPLLRSANVKYPFELGIEFSGYQLDIDRGLGGKSNLTLLECKVNKFKISCKEGGTVEISFRIQAQRVSEETRGLMSSYIKGAMTAIALKPPGIKQEAIDGTVGHPGAAKAKAPTKPEKEAKPALKATPPGRKTPAKDAGDAFAAALGVSPLQ